MAKILLVEDDSNLREIYGARLEAEGYEIAAASDGEEALATAVKERPDLIISDVMMPKISGFDMLDILRSTPETKNVKVIVMTALSQEEDRQRGEQLGADRYIVKSQVTLDDVVTMVRELLGEASVPQAVPQAQPSNNPAIQQDSSVAQGAQPQQVAVQSDDPALQTTAISSDDAVALDQEVQEFVATSPLMGGSPPAQQQEPQPEVQAAPPSPETVAQPQLQTPPEQPIQQPVPQVQPPAGPPALS